MIASFDKEYKDTKLIKQGKKKLSSPLLDLAKWIEREYAVSVLNISYNFARRKAPTLDVIFEYPKDEEKFKDGLYGYNKEKQSSIADKYVEIINSAKPLSLKYRTNDVWVIFSSFEHIARSEANENIPQNKIEELKVKINNPDLWEISRLFSSVTFFFYTDKQVKEYKKTDFEETVRKEYYKLLKPYDEFCYLSEFDFPIYLDSKENFDTNNDSNWWYYYK